MAVQVTPQGTRGGGRLDGPVLKAGMALNVCLYRLLRGAGMKGRMLLLTTVGARSGAERTTPLAWFPDGDEAWLIVASAGGSTRHPAWYTNLARNSGRVWIEVGDRKLRVRPESLHGPERAERWQRIVAASPNFAGYERRTDRELPVIRLTPAA
ncbi:MAG: nitroreductase family deazaflavin-dependent oxidoreductase [Candidatus Dormibacteraeota bacterium]|nr:nitroreductase family deazaflavin-dependent oxidoreductase [Candidatus Dormibacteraeota bacterium]